MLVKIIFTILITIAITFLAFILFVWDRFKNYLNQKNTPPPSQFDIDEKYADTIENLTLENQQISEQLDYAKEELKAFKRSVMVATIAIASNPKNSNFLKEYRTKEKIIAYFTNGLAAIQEIVQE